MKNMNKVKQYILAIYILLCLGYVLYNVVLVDVRNHFFESPETHNLVAAAVADYDNITGEIVLTPDFPTDYVLYFKFDTDIGGITPDQTGINHGILIGDAVITNDLEKGSFLSLDGIGDYVQVADNLSLDLQYQITLSVWLKLNQLPVSITKIIVKPTEEGLEPWEVYALDVKRNTGEIRFILSDGTSYYENGWHSVVSTLALNQWNHIVGTYDGRTMKLYANKSLVNSKDVNLNIGVNNQDVFIGRWLSGSCINGFIDDVMIFNRALSIAEIEEIYDEQMPYIDSEDQYMIGLFFTPAATNYLKEGVYTNYDHSIFLSDYSDLVDTLSGIGFNTIVINTHYRVYRYEFDTQLNNAQYPVYGGFDSEEIKIMVQIAKQKGMKVIPSLQVLSHQNSGILSQVYPNYMLSEPAWKEGQYYSPINCVEIAGIVYHCTTNNISSLSNKPGYGANWTSYWRTGRRRTRDPFNENAEQMVFGMIDELIETFTVESEKPEAIHIATDELRNWPTPEESNEMSASEVFAMTITNIYDHIKESNPDMNVIMWSDMLDENWNGGRTETPVAGALDMLPKDIIIDDWRYETTSYYGYDEANRIFPSVGKYIDKGFNVLVSPWNKQDAAEDLIWTGKIENIGTGKFKGVIYAVWLGNPSYAVPGLNHALTDYTGWEDLIPDSYRYATTPSPVDILAQEIADVIENTIDIINSGE